MSSELFLGDDLDVYFAALDVKGAVIDLTGATVACSMAPVDGSAGKITSSSVAIDAGTGGTGRVRFTSAQTAGCVAGKSYSYDVRARLASSLVRTVGYGTLEAKAAVTSTP